MGNIEVEVENKKQDQGEESFSKALLWVAGGVVLGAVTAFFLDPDRGRRRRVRLRDQILSKSRHLKEGAHKISSDLKNRAYGTLAELQAKLHSEELDDEILNRRVRSEFGRCVRHSKSIHTSVSKGVVTLSGPILEEEVDELLKCVKHVNGVREVINHLIPHEKTEGISDPQGSGPEYLQ